MEKQLIVMSEKQFKCIYCDAEYDDKESIDRHVEYAHTLYKKGNVEKTELTAIQKTKKFLRRHPVIFSALSWIIWGIATLSFPDIMLDGFVQIMAFSMLGLGLGVALVYELMSFGG